MFSPVPSLTDTSVCFENTTSSQVIIKGFFFCLSLSYKHTSKSQEVEEVSSFLPITPSNHYFIFVSPRTPAPLKPTAFLFNSLDTGFCFSHLHRIWVLIHGDLNTHVDNSLNILSSWIYLSSQLSPT